MESLGTEFYMDGGRPGGASSRLRAALDREAARRATRDPENTPHRPSTIKYRTHADPIGLASIRERAWLVPKGPFIAMGRLALALAGIAGLLLLGLLAAAGVALVQLHFPVH